MDQSEGSPNNGRGNDNGGSDSLTSGGHNFSGAHVPAPNSHGPRIERHTSADGSKWRLEEANGSDEAYIEFAPTGVQ